MTALRSRRAPRVLMTTDAVGGVWTYAVDLAAGLAKTGVETTLVVLGPAPSADQAAAAEAIAGLSLLETGLPLDWLAAEPAEILEVGAAIRGLARGSRVDLIHLNSPAVAAIGGFSAPVLGACHSCLATWWSAVKEGPMPPEFRWRTQLLWQGLHACDALVAPTRAFADATARTYDLPTPDVVWNGRRPSAGSLRAARQPVAFASGRLWDEGKNIRALDEAAALMRAPLYAAGPLRGPDASAVELRSAHPVGGLSADEVGLWLQHASVYASAALYEPFGLGVLEAAQAGCALVLSDIPTFRELWDDAAVFLPANDAAGFAEAMNRLLADEAQRLALARRARARAARYSLEAMTAGVLGVYRRLSPQPFALPAAEVAA